jgi:hypothetical protein
MTWPPRSGWLVAGAAASFAIALLHLAIIAGGAPAYEWATAPDRLVELARQRHPWPTIVTGALAGLFVVFGLYALAGAGLLVLPAQRVLVIAIGCIYLLRGTLIVPEALLVHFAGRPVRTLAFAGAAFAIGLVHLVGAWRRWPLLDGPGPRPTARTSD